MSVQFQIVNRVAIFDVIVFGDNKHFGNPDSKLDIPYIYYVFKDLHPVFWRARPVPAMWYLFVPLDHKPF